MSTFDGTDEPLDYAGALLATVGRVSFATEAQQAEVVRAIRVEHGLPVEDVKPAGGDEDPRDARIRELEEKFTRLAANSEHDDTKVSTPA